MNRRVLLFGCMLLLAALAASQTSGPEIAVGSVLVARPGGGIVAVTGAPYSAEETDEIKQTLADGTHIDRTMPVVKIYRDSMGRTRTERSLAHGSSATQSGSAQGTIMVEINDPIAHKRYIFNSEKTRSRTVRSCLLAPPDLRSRRALDRRCPVPRRHFLARLAAPPQPKNWELKSWTG